MLSLVLALGLLSGCASFGRGVAEAVLAQAEREDTRACHIEGPSSHGLESLLREQEDERREGDSRRQLKILMVHGIGKHLPGYSGRFTEHLMREFRLEVREEDYKEIVLRDPDVMDGPLGKLRISRYMNKERTREVLFYELTWSEITEAERTIIEFDDSTEYSFRRASLNAYFKKFFNSHVPDSLVFLGEPQLPILTSVRQSLCWMTHGDWNDYADFADEPCNLMRSERLKHLQEDDFVVVTHSLGSRIAVDTLQHFANISMSRETPQLAGGREIVQAMEFRVYMLANQLPLLEMGQKRAEVRGQTGSYCRPEGEHFDQRFFRRLSIYAFSDPNDILSYPIPPKFAEDYVDSRLCTSPTNITINVAKPISLFGLGEFANPAEAHGGYDHDERVISLIAHGIGQENTAEIVKERCTWLETTENGS
jgi:hypothetical protein